MWFATLVAYVLLALVEELHLTDEQFVRDMAYARAQILRALHDFGAPTFDQDFVLYLWTR